MNIKEFEKSGTDLPIKVVQFGEGNFLKGFADYILDMATEQNLFDGSVAIVKAIEMGSLEKFDNQDNKYTVILRGMLNGKKVEDARIITNISKTVDSYGQYNEYANLAKLESLRFVISNTTEAGIVYDETDSIENNPPKTFPGKLTKFLFERFNHFNGDEEKGLIILPCELIEANGKQLKKCVEQFIDLWKLPNDFKNWVENSCIFCSTLVDRIVTGYPFTEIEEMEEKLGYKDELITTAEPFGLWVIESDKEFKSELPIDKIEKEGLEIIYTNDQSPYRERKVRILNGGHTSMVLMAYLCGKDYVLECMQDDKISKFLKNTLFTEIIPTLELPEEELKSFAGAVIERFENPFIKHSLLSISLNSVSKWKARVLKSFEIYVDKNKELPKLLTFSFASLLAFYNGDTIVEGALIGNRNGEEYKIIDDLSVLEFVAENSKKSSLEYTTLMTKQVSFWGKDLSEIDGFVDTVANHLEQIRKDGMEKTLENLLK